MTKKAESAQVETGVTVVTLTLTLPIADHLGRVLNAIQYSGNAVELRQLLSNHDQLVIAFNEAVKNQ